MEQAKQALYALGTPLLAILHTCLGRLSSHGRQAAALPCPRSGLDKKAGRRIGAMAARKAVCGLAAQLPPGAAVGLSVNQPPVSFFREIARYVPELIRRYRLEELVTARQLNQYVGDMFRANAGTTDPRSINLLVFRGREELDLIQRMHKQRHHLITKYIHQPQEAAAAANAASKRKISPFLAAFYQAN
eukprot:jgi/Tetstr1/421563/TSEL_012507.t1